MQQESESEILFRLSTDERVPSHGPLARGSRNAAEDP